MKNFLNKHFVIFSVFIFALSSAAVAQKNSDKGDKLFDKNMFTEAIPFYELEIKEKDKNTIDHAMLKLADCYRITGEFEKAEETYRTYLKKKKKDPTAVLNYALSLKSSAKYAEAAVQFAEYIKLNPSDPLGKIFLKSCDLAQIWLDETIGKEVRNVEKINSPASDFAPVFLSPSELVFTSSRVGATEALISFNGGNEMRRLDLYDVDINSIDEKTKVEIENLKAINTSMHEGPATFSKDGKEIYFTRTASGKRNTKTNKVLNTLQIFYCSKDSTGKWSKPVSAFSFNSSEYSVGQPSISKDGKNIYFMSDMPGGKGATDIYYCTRQKDGTWSKPINAGAEVNTFGHELFPYISDNGILYFSSDTHPGMGQLDIFMSEFDGFEWTDVINLKPPINSIANDFGIALDGKYMRGFFSSDRFNGKGAEDIYSFSETTPLKLTINGGSMQFPDKSIYDGIKYKLVDEKSAETQLVPKKGMYYLALNESQNYTLVAKKNGFSYNKISINITRDTLGKYIEVKLKPSLRTILADGCIISNVMTDSAKTEEKAVENVSVSLVDSTTTIEKTSTNKNGFFEFHQMLNANESYSIIAKNIPRNDISNPIIICKGVIKHKGSPVTGAAVQLLENGKLSESITTNKKGDYIFELLSGKKYSLRAYKNGFDTSSTSFMTAKADIKNGIYKTLTLDSLKKTASIGIKGFVKDTSGFLKNAQIILRIGNQIIKEIRSDNEGAFSFQLLPNNEYQISAASKGYMQKDIEVSTKDNLANFKSAVEIILDPIKVNSSMIWENILFVYGKSEVEASSLPTLDKLVKFMKTNPEITIELSAHTDTQGDAESNMVLSQERAQYAKSYLTMEDIEPIRVLAIGYGESRPLIPNEKTEKDYQTNRRIEVRIIKQ